MDDDDINVKVALGVVGGIIALVIALVIGVAVGEVGTMGEASATASASAEMAAPEPVGEALVKLYFGVDQASLPDEGAAAVQTIIVTAQDKAEAIVLISGFHDASGNAAHNAELSKQRAIAVRDALVAAGLDVARIRLSKPASTQGSGEAQEARRVEVRVQ